MNSSYLFLAGALASMTAFSPAVHAACRAPYATATCSGTSGSNNCTQVSATKVECDFNPADQGVSAIFVSPTSTSFQAYGVDGDGDDFCCEYTVTDGCTYGLITVNIFGTDYDDTLVLYDHLTEDSLDCSTATVLGDEGDDIIDGANVTTNDDYLHGQGGDDTIHGHNGDDHIYGESGDDYLYGNNGVDTIYGSDGSDHIFGGLHNDYLYGGDDIDYMCGMAGSDHLFGNGGIDEILGNGGVDYNDGGTSGSDNCENENMSGSCTAGYTLDQTCPWPI